MKIIFYIFSLVFLIYLLWPGPTSINDFPPLPGSVKSTLEGDTIQVPNVAGYFSNNYRKFATQLYKESYQQNSRLPFSPIKLNYPPEFAFTAIKDQTHSTYLEEYVYPLRGSLFINGLEPFYEDGQDRFPGAYWFDHGGNLWETKVTLRYYPVSFLVKIAVWLGVNISIIFIWKLARRIL